MVLAPVLQSLGPLGSPPGLLVGVVLLALVILLGRFVLAVAWRLIVIAVVAIAALWLLSILGFGIGIF